MTRKSYDGSIQKLVFSDEFNTGGRTFYDGDDPYFQAVDIWYGATQDLEVSGTCITVHSFALTHSSGMTPMRPTLRTAPSTSSLKSLIVMDSTIHLAWSNRGTNCVTRAVILKPVSHCLAEAISVVSGPVSGQWATWLDLGTLAQLKACGRTVTTTIATLVSHQTRVPTMV